MGNYGQGGLGAGPIAGGAGALAALPNTGGSRNVVLYVALASIVLGTAIVASNLVRFAAKHRISA